MNQLRRKKQEDLLQREQGFNVYINNANSDRVVEQRKRETEGRQEEGSVRAQWNNKKVQNIFKVESKQERGKWSNQQRQHIDEEEEEEEEYWQNAIKVMDNHSISQVK